MANVTVKLDTVVTVFSIEIQTTKKELVLSPHTTGIKCTLVSLTLTTSRAKMRVKTRMSPMLERSK